MIGLYLFTLMGGFTHRTRCSSGVHSGEGGQQQRLAIPRLHQHQEQDEFPVCKPQRQRFLGPTHLGLPAANT